MAEQFPPRCAECADPLAARAAKVVLVTFFRGEGDTRREVLQVFAEDGELLAEHDGFHVDPVYASYFLRQHATPEMLRVWGEQAQAGVQPSTQEVPHG